MNDAALLDSLHAALRNPDLAWYTEFHAGESIVAGYLDSLTDPYDDDAPPRHGLGLMIGVMAGTAGCRRGLSRSRTCLWRTPVPKSGSHGRR